jgi:DnaJ-class molecular chaperone
MTHYATLGVSETASQDEIKRAYRSLASKHHPDKGGDTARFQSIQAAYAAIETPEKRAQYDAERNNPAHGQFTWTNQHTDVNINDLFRHFNFGGADPFAAFRQQQQPRRNRDLRIDISIPLVQTLQDNVKTISVQTTNGHRETVEVRIPRGIAHGTVIKYNGLGDNLFNTIERGDLHVHVNVHNAENFVANGIDLHTKVSVNCLLAVTGGETLLTTLDQKILSLNIPAGTQPGVKFRISNQGLYQMNTDIRGHLYAELSVFIPTDLSPEQLEMVRSLTTSH